MLAPSPADLAGGAGDVTTRLVERILYVDSGTYVENVVIPRSVSIIGPTPPASPAIIDGSGTGTVVTIMASTVVELSYLTIQNGVGTELVGAGVDSSGDLWLRNSSVVMNSGPGIFKQWAAGGPDLHVIDSQVAGNSGYGIWGNSVGTIQVKASEISGNNRSGVAVNYESISITDGSVLEGNSGAAVFAYNSLAEHVLIVDATLDGNGMGVSVEGSRLTISNTRIMNSPSGYGVSYLGSVGTGPEEATITDSTVVGNYGGVALGGFYCGGRHRIERSLIASNARSGIVISCAREAEIVNTTISGNGRGVSTVKSYDRPPNTVTLSNVTITDNHADSGVGGGLNAFGGWGPYSPDLEIVRVHNSIIVGNTAAGVPDDCATSGAAFVETDGFNVLGSIDECILSAPAGDLVGVDPLLGPLADNGGPTLTHALLPGSPAIDAGDPAGCAGADGALLLVDQRGQPRPVGPRCDIGAYEAGP